MGSSRRIGRVNIGFGTGVLSPVGKANPDPTWYVGRSANLLTKSLVLPGGESFHSAFWVIAVVSTCGFIPVLLRLCKRKA